ncbi:MAG: hypothetical protein QXU98_07245 [Candidatus Parvarchaeota archaeon]
MRQENRWNSIQKIPDYLDEEDYLAVLAIGQSELTHGQIQIISYLISTITGLKGNFVSMDGEYFSETLMEKITTPLNRHIFKIKGDKYMLTHRGIEIENEIIKFLAPEIRQNTLAMLANLREMNDSELEIWKNEFEKQREAMK